MSQTNPYATRSNLKAGATTEAAADADAAAAGVNDAEADSGLVTEPGAKA